MKDPETTLVKQVEENHCLQNDLSLHKEPIEVWVATVSFLLIFAWIGYSIWWLIHRLLPFGA